MKAHMQEYIYGVNVVECTVLVCECLLPDSDVKMNACWESSGGDPAVSGVRSYQREGHLVFLFPQAPSDRIQYHNSISVYFKPSQKLHGGKSSRTNPFRNTCLRFVFFMSLRLSLWKHVLSLIGLF